MLSTRLASWMAGRNLHYGWLVAATTFLTMLATAGAMGSAGVMIQPLHQEFGWDIADISSAMAVRLVLFGLLGPFAAAFMNHFGIRQVVSTALALIMGGIVASFFMTEVWQLLLLWGVVIGVGTGMTALVLGATVATRWFSKRRGLVIGLMTASNATGQLVFLPLLAALTEAYGWRTALTLSVAVIATAMVLVLLLMRDHPADVGLPAYGETVVTKPVKQDHNLLARAASTGLPPQSLPPQSEPAPPGSYQRLSHRQTRAWRQRQSQHWQARRCFCFYSSFHLSYSAPQPGKSPEPADDGGPCESSPAATAWEPL